jgi:hypothetical protein
MIIRTIIQYQDNLERIVTVLKITFANSADVSYYELYPQKVHFKIYIKIFIHPLLYQSKEC